MTSDRFEDQMLCITMDTIPFQNIISSRAPRDRETERNQASLRSPALPPSAA